MGQNQLGFWNRFQFGKKSSRRSLRQVKAWKRKMAVESLENRRLLAGGRALGSVAGTIFNDQNASTVRESGEPVLRGWIVYADTNNNARLDRGEPSAISGRDGTYRLPLKPGTYTIREVLPANWIVSTSDQVLYPAEVTVEAGSSTTQDFGNQHQVGTVSGKVFNDLDGNGTFDATESGQPGWRVYSDTNENGQFDRGEPATISGRDGSWQLTLAPGNYTIREESRNAWSQTTPADGSFSVAVEVGDSLTGNDFGNQKAIGTVSGTVFNDADGNTNLDLGEGGLGGWRVFADKNDNGLFDRGEPTAITAADGSYRLALAAGTYSIVEVIQTNWQVTTPDGGSVSVSVTVGQSLTGIDFGNQLTETAPPSTGSFQIQLSMTGFTSSVQSVVEQAADRWEQVIVGDLPDVQYRGQTIDDVLISVVSLRIDGVGNTLAEAGPTAFRMNGGLPFLGSVMVDTADIAQMQSSNELFDVMVHEIGHVLGFGTMWNSKGTLTGTRTSDPQFTGKLAVAEYNAIFSTSVTGVPVENTGGTGTALAHWRQ
jgi:hypothetical protein